MHWLVVAVICVLAGSITAQLDVSVTSGDGYTFNIFAVGQTITSCHLNTPHEGSLNFSLDQPSVNQRYELEPSGPLPSCSVRVKDLTEADNGIWEVAYRTADGGDSALFNLTVAPRDEDEQFQLDKDVIWLNPIEFPTREGQNIEISLSKTAYPEDCYIRKLGINVGSGDDIEGVTFHDSSDFVSCRVTIGPMEEALLGDWALCAKRTDNSEKQDRCQLVKVAWHDSARPNNMWSTVTQAKFDHVVHYGGTLTPTVLGHGNRLTCHIITPEEEDLVINADSDYPNIILAPSSTTTCSIAIGPIQESMLGNWTLYGKFRDFTGVHEVRLPMNLFLYDSKNPHNQAYNVTVRDPVKRAVNLGSPLTIEVDNIGKVDSCQAETPSGETFDLDSAGYEGVSFVDVGESIACRITIGSVTKQILGKWTIIGKFSNSGRFTEEQQTFEVLEEDPENPIIDDDRVIQNMATERVTTEIGAHHRLIIPSSFFIEGESCHIRTPSGLQYTIMHGFNVDGVEVIEGDGVECGVTVHVGSEEAVGEWTLIARATQYSQLIERRLPFTISVEETVNAIPAKVTTFEGNDVYVRLASPTEQHGTCKLVGPTKSESSPVVDPLQTQSCGYIIMNVTTDDAGTWEITYGSRISYKASIVVSVIENSTIDTDFNTTIGLIRGQLVNEIVGPKSAVYCRLMDPQGVVVFDGFGNCTLALDEVTSRHKGAWEMLVTTAGRVVAVQHQLYVNVTEPDSKPVVTARVEQNKPTIVMICSVATEAAVRGCRFTDPQGNVLLAVGGMAEDRYVFHGNETSYVSEVRSHECGLQISEPLASDLGIWRCAIETEEDTYYSFIDVLCPWALQNETVAATVQQEPILEAQRSNSSALEGESVTMACEVRATIRYCYFRAPNGTTFTVSPAMSSANMEYVGAGFEAGECGVRFHGIGREDAGLWSCHVGLVRDFKEQNDTIYLDIHEAMKVRHFYSASEMVVEGVVHGGPSLDYCRFVRIDGFGFTTDHIPFGYTDPSHLKSGECRLRIKEHTTLDRRPWTVVAKVHGQDVEIARNTILLTGGSNEINLGELKWGPLFFYLILCLLLLSIFMGACLGPKKNREWTYSRASVLRASLRNSFRKQPIPLPAPNAPPTPPAYQV